MSLLDEAMENCVFMEKRLVQGSYGEGYVPMYTEGLLFKAAFALDSSTAARVAASQGVKNLYTITTSRALTLEFHDVLKRVSDGKYFRITSDGEDMKTPASATLDMRNVSAEEWVLPYG